MILEGTTSSGAVVPVQVTGDGKVVAEGLQGPQGPEGPQGPPGPAGGYWERTGTVVSPINTGDQLLLDGRADVRLDANNYARINTNGSFVSNTDDGSTTSLFNIVQRPSATEVADIRGDGSARFSGEFKIASTSGPAAVSLDPGATGSPLVRDSNGNLGVGTATPNNQLSVVAASGGAYIDVSAGGRTLGTDSIYLGQESTGNVVLFSRSNDALRFGTNDTERAQISAAGVFTLGDGTTNAVTLDPGSTGVPLVRDSVGRLLVGMNNAPAGTLAGDVVCKGAVVLQSPNGMWWAIEVQDDGTLYASQTSIR